MKKYGLVFIFACCFTLLPLLVVAQASVVEALLFYSPSCPHCHEVMNDLLVPMSLEYGESLQILAVDVSQPEGQVVYQQAIQTYAIPDARLGVPTLIVADYVLVGSEEIPALFPSLVEQGLAANGSRYSFAGDLSVATPLVAPVASSAPMDALGAAIASLTMLILLVSLGYALMHLIWRRETWLLADGPLLVYAKSWALPLLFVLGLIVAGYLSYVEVTQVEAVCGPIEGCNQVQSSPYARIQGVPIALLGLTNYLLLMALWFGRKYFLRTGENRSLWLMLGLAFIGVFFSLYLTGLELFVIRAVCLWCISSALITGGILVLLALVVSSQVGAKRRRLRT